MSKSPDLIEMPDQHTKSEELIKATIMDESDCSQKWNEELGNIEYGLSQAKTDAHFGGESMDLIQRGKIDPGIDPFGDISEPMGCVCPLQHGPIDHRSKLKPHDTLTPIQNELIPKLFRNR